MEKNIFFRSVGEHRRAFINKEYSSLDLTSAFLDRIKELDGELNAFITVDTEGALAAAKRADAILSESPDSTHPLCGIPYSAKDNICTKGVATTCASRFLEGYIPPYSATVIEKLDAAGAVLLGKTNMDEFGMGSTTENSRYGHTKNPHDSSRVAGGSSGGSAAAVALGLSVFSLGSDTGGSVRLPSSYCGTVGIKPTYGTVSRYGLVAFASSLETIAPITRTLLDNALVLSAIRGSDRRDTTALQGVGGDTLSTELSENSAHRPLRVGVPLGVASEYASREVADILLETAKKLETQGIETVDIPSLPSPQKALAAYYVISSAEASSNLGRFDGVRFGRRAESADSLEALYLKSRSEGFGEEVKRRIMLGTFALSSGYYEEYYKTASLVRARITREYEALLRAVDAILMPVAPSAAPLAGEMGERHGTVTAPYALDIFNVPANLTSLPSLAFPAGKTTQGHPVGLQLMGAPHAEDLLYSLAKRFVDTDISGKEAE